MCTRTALVSALGLCAWFLIATAPARDRVDVEVSRLPTTKDWPQYGGSSHRNNVSRDRNIPVSWRIGDTGEKLKNVKWAARLGSQTHGSPVVSGQRVFIGSNNGAGLNKEYPSHVDLGCLLCFDRKTGRFVWQHSNQKLPTGRVNDWPMQGVCSTPYVDGERLWYVTNRGEVVCLDVEGFEDDENDGPFLDEPFTETTHADVVWKFSMIDELGAHPHNMSNCSVTCAGTTLFVNTSNGVDETHIKLPKPTAPSFVAMDRTTGKVLWTDNRSSKNTFHGQWSSPAYGVLGGRPQVLFGGGDGWLYSFDPAGDGKGGSRLLWKFDCNSKTSEWKLGGRGTRNNLVTAPVIHAGRVYMVTGQDPEHGEGDADLWCIDPTGNGDVSSDLAVDKQGRPLPQRRLQAVDPKKGERAIPNPNSKLVWRYTGTDLNGNGKLELEERLHRSIRSPAIAGGLVFVADFAGFVHCIDDQTGRAHWISDLFAASWCGPFIAGNRVYVGDEDGEVAIFAVSPDPRLSLERDRNGYSNPRVEISMEQSLNSTPAAADGVFYIATRNTLYAIANDAAD